MSIIVTAADKVKALMEASEPVMAGHPSGLRQVCNSLCTLAGINAVPELRTMKTASAKHWKGYTLPKQRTLIFDPNFLDLYTPEKSAAVLASTFESAGGVVDVATPDMKIVAAHKVGQLVGWKEGRPLDLIERRADTFTRINTGDDAQLLDEYIRSKHMVETEEGAGLGFLQMAKNIVKAISDNFSSGEKRTLRRVMRLEREISPYDTARLQGSMREYDSQWQQPEAPAQHRTAQATLDHKIQQALAKQRAASVNDKMGRA